MAKRIDNGDALLMQLWQSKLENESQEHDILSGSSGTFAGKEGSIVDSAVMKVNFPPGVNDYTIGMLLDLTGAGREGAGKALVGFTESQTTRQFQVFANDVRHGVENEMYGLNHHRTDGYKMVEKAHAQLTRWMKFRRGRHMREAFLESFSSNLVAAPTSRTKHWNRHVLVKNVLHSAQPSYDSTLSDYTGNIVTALTTAGTGVGAQSDNQLFTDVEEFVANVWKIRPFDDGSYIYLVPSRQAVYLKRLNNTNESFANYQKDAHVEKYVNAAYGNYLTKFGKFHLIEDNRAPVIDHTTATGTLTAYYRDVGSTDNRSSAVGDVYDQASVYGKSALTEGIAMRPRYDNDITDFHRLESIGVTWTNGFQVTEYDDDTPTDSTRIGQNAGVVLTARGAATV